MTAVTHRAGISPTEKLPIVVGFSSGNYQTYPGADPTTFLDTAQPAGYEVKHSQSATRDIPGITKCWAQDPAERPAFNQADRQQFEGDRERRRKASRYHATNACRAVGLVVQQRNIFIDEKVLLVLGLLDEILSQCFARFIKCQLTVSICIQVA